MAMTGIDLRQLRHFLGWLLPTALSIGALLVLAADSQRRMVQL